MVSDPRLIHILDQLSGDLAYFSDFLKNREERLIEGGMEPERAREIIHTLELALSGCALDDAEELFKELAPDEEG